MNLFEQFDELMTDKLVEKISILSNDTSNNTYKSLKGIYYTLVAGLIRRGNSTMSSNMLYNQVQRGGQKGALVTNLEVFLHDQNAFGELVDKGNKMLSQVFPAFKSPLISMVSTYAETPKPAAVSYSGFLSALLVDIIDKKIANENLTTEQLTVYLQRHHQPLLTDSPEGLLEVMIPALGLHELRNVKFAAPSKKNAQREEEELVAIPTVIESDTDYDDLARRRGVSVTTIIGLLIAVVGIAAFAWWYFNIRPNSVATAAADEVATEVPVYTADSVVVDSSTVANNAGGESPASFEANLRAYLNDGTAENGRVLPIDEIQFINGTASIDPSAKTTLDGLSTVFKEYPRLQIRILGYDVAGDKAMASKRAYAIKQELLNRGVDNNRIDAGGISTASKNTVSVKVISK